MCLRTTISFCLQFLSLVLLALTPAVAQDSSKVAKSKERSEAEEVLSSATTEDKDYALKKYIFLDEAVGAVIDTALTGDLKLEFESGTTAWPFFLDKKGLQGLLPMDPTYSPYDIPQMRNPDIPQTVPLTQAVQSLLEAYRKSRKNAKHGQWPVPTDLEIDVMKVLWVEGQATSGEIYAKLDTSTMIFAEELQAALARMVDRGFLDRKKISPSHGLNMFGLAQIELSSKNRKNKVYLYWPVVTKEELYTYLDAKRYLASIEQRSKDDYDIQNNKYVDNYQKYLEKKLFRMFDDKGAPNE